MLEDDKLRASRGHDGRVRDHRRRRFGSLHQLQHLGGAPAVGQCHVGTCSPGSLQTTDARYLKYAPSKSVLGPLSH